jgi:aminoglycoside 3-N-acetyltransferase
MSIIKKALRFINKMRKKWMKKFSKPITIETIEKDLRKIGLRSGDVVLVHSALSKIGMVEGGAPTVIHALEKIIGLDGTLVIPTFTIHGTMLATCMQEGYIFDPRETPTTTGAIPAAFLKEPGIRRSIHPTHPLAAKGKYAEDIIQTHHLGTTFDKTSPFAKVVEHKGKILGLGIDLAWHTIYHHVEDLMGDAFPVRVYYKQSFTIQCKDYDGKLLNVEVKPHDPEVSLNRLEKNAFILNYLTDIFVDQGLLTYHDIGKGKSWCTDATAFCNCVERLARVGVTIYSLKQDLIDKGVYPLEKLKDALKSVKSAYF